MKIEINLRNVNFCDGCPCLFSAPNEYPYSCNMEYWDAYGINKDKEKEFERPNICTRNHGV